MFKRIAALLAVPMVLSAQDPARPVVQPPPIDPAQGRLITLDEAIRLAQQNSPAALQARGNIRTRALAVRSAYAAFLPTLNTSVGLSRSFFSDDDERPWGHSNSISSSITLFDPLRYYDVGEAKRNVDLAEAAEIQGRYSISLQVKQQYFNALNARESEAAALSALEVAQQSYRAAVARVRAGSATTSDSLRALITVGNRRIELLSAQNSLRQANVALSRLVLDNVPHIQAHWTRMGAKLSQSCLLFGADDIDAVPAADALPHGPRRAILEEVRRNLTAASLTPIERDGAWVVHEASDGGVAGQESA